eukprot:1666966-Pyramimonas_sp.AAC.1
MQSPPCRGATASNPRRRATSFAAPGSCTRSGAPLLTAAPLGCATRARRPTAGPKAARAS